MSPGRAAPGGPQAGGCQAWSRVTVRGAHCCYGPGAATPAPFPPAAIIATARGTPRKPLAAERGQVLFATQSSRHAAPTAAAPGRLGSRSPRCSPVCSLLRAGVPGTDRAHNPLLTPHRSSIPATTAPSGPVPPHRRPATAPHRERGSGSTGSSPGEGPALPHGLTWRAGAAPPSCCPPRRARSW